MKNIEHPNSDLAEILAYIIKTTFVFVTLFVQKSLENNFRERLCNKESNMKVLYKKIFPNFHFWYAIPLYISQSILHYQHKYLLRLRLVTGPHV
jgi:hypothetical protein